MKHGMIRTGAVALAIVIAGPVVVPPEADAALVMCKRKKRIKVREDACKGKEEQVPATELGVVGPDGPQGMPGPAGPQGPQGEPGEQGVPGPLLQTLPAGASLRGVYTFAGRKTTGYSPTAPISYQFPLAFVPSAEVVPIDGGPTANCPGTSDDPQAVAGFLCVYETRNDTDTALVVFPAALGNGSLGAQLFSVVPADTNFEFDGVWAVTAP